MPVHLAKVNVPLYLRDKRARKLARRLNREWRSERSHQSSLRAFDAAFGARSQIVDLMASSAVPEESNLRTRKIRFTLPPSFSIIDSPERAIAALANFARAMRTDKRGTVYIDFSKLSKYDLGANGLLDVIVDELSVESKRSGRIVRWRGNFPSDPAHARFVRAMGVIKRLKVVKEYPSPQDEPHLTLFDKRCRHYMRVLRPHQIDMKSRITAEFSDHINRCLKTIDRQLTPDARRSLCAYVGEILDNAEQHSGRLDWAIQGYLDTQVEIPMCEVVIFNFGRSIAETFEALPPESFTRLQIQRYIDLHTKRRLFSAVWRKEDLYTLIALQGNVSSKNEKDTDTRGNGTVDLIEFFQRMHAECSAATDASARMVIVSGSTSILFDGTYKMESQSNGAGVIAFNAGNSLEDLPDREYVRKLEGVCFPGTLIGLMFPLSTSKSTVEASGDES